MCLEADVCVWEGGVFLCVYEMVCVWWYVYRSIVGACCVWGCYMWERVLDVCGVLCVLCVCVRALYRGVVHVCVCSACGGMGGCVEVASWELLVSSDSLQPHRLQHTKHLGAWHCSKYTDSLIPSQKAMKCCPG